MDLILASNSPRRRELLALGGWQFQVRAAEVDETPLTGEPAPAYVARLAREKALAVARQMGLPGDSATLILAADTTVVDGNRILGKPADSSEAVRMLRQLRGRQHQVYTALALLCPTDRRLWETLCLTEVPMRHYSDTEIQAYVASGDPLDKAGAYAIQHAGFHPVESLQGCYANVMGLPLCHLARLLHQVGMEPHRHLAQACQDSLAYDCSVYPEILGESRYTLTQNRRG